MAALHVLRPGARTLVQDMGFATGRGLGVPLCGVLDPETLLLLNALLDNPPGAAALELAMTAPVLQAVGGAVRIALGPGLAGRIRAETGEMRPIGPWQETTLAPRAVLELDRPERGAPALIGIGGGLDLPRILGSRSTCLAAGFGGLEGRALRAGDLLPVPDDATGAAGGRTLPPPPPLEGPIRVVPGPQDDSFGRAGLSRFLAAEWTLSPALDRMGARLAGPKLDFAPGRGADILSDGITPGAIQVPGNGQPIVLLADAQTTGGYAKIATVIRADLPRLARMMPGDTLCLAAVTVPEAEAAARARAADLRRAAATRRALMQDRVDEDALWRAALEGGMVDMTRPDHFPGALDDG
ncbi:MAG: biotin-dependent carboxyltransferase family protein [Rubellimicrobium sp.]|nr:biotin-dependent carboxyltransferase family protein [Rubellimicrobium sp.]